MAWLGMALLFGAGPICAEKPRCAGHGGVAGCDSSSGRVLCSDGALDVRYPCSGSAHKRRQPRQRVLKFKPPTNRGQILSPGEKPPPTTLEKSK
jgi:hypothetical protein